MRLPRTRVNQRVGFTLVELIVVMGIIAVLASLTTVAVFAAFTKMHEVECRTELDGLAGGIKEFQAEYNITIPPPSRIWLDETGQYNVVPVGVPAGTTLAQLAQLQTDSVAYLHKVWPHINLANIDWNSNGTIDKQGFVLEGEQCLVFFLGGARNASGSFIGFSVDTTNPMNANPNVKRKGPWFKFVTSRITAGPSSGFPMYLDSYSSSGIGVPYAYFSSGIRGDNHYLDYQAALGSDCPSLTGINASGQSAPLLPYCQPFAAGQAPVFYHANTFQIISAGKNAVFGPGGAWTPNLATTIGRPGSDDITNFHTTKMGIAP